MEYFGGGSGDPSSRGAGLRARPLGRAPPFHPAIVLQTIQQSREGRAFDTHPLGDLFLSELVSPLGEMDEGPPFSLAQAQRAQPPVELRPPGAGGPEKDETEFVDVGRRHRPKKWLAC